MGYIPITPFGRRVDSVLLNHRSARDTAPACPAVDKWEALRCLAAARQDYGLSDRDLGVLQALLSFHKSVQLDLGHSPVVHASNQTICDRLNGMANSTMRRHIARLVDAGVILRRDSPNGKRYVRRTGAERVAYGFDLSPLVTRFAEFSDAADRIRAAEARLTRLRETVSLMRRDLAALADFGLSDHPNRAAWERFSDLARLTARTLRRKLNLAELEALQTELAAALGEVRSFLEMGDAPEMSTSPARNEHHHQTSKKELRCEDPVDKSAPEVPLAMVLTRCPEIQSFTPERIRDWPGLVRASCEVRPMMGISGATWDRAVEVIGRHGAAAVLAAMLERFGRIRSPEGYLRHLLRKAGEGQFSVLPMLGALENRGGFTAVN